MGCLWKEAGCGTVEGTWQLVQFVVRCPLGAGWQPCTQAGHPLHGVRAQGASMPQGNPGHKVPLGIRKRGSQSVLCDNPWV